MLEENKDKKQTIKKDEREMKKNKRKKKIEKFVYFIDGFELN